jgi:histidine triad (HIT) family protein
MENCLFCKIVKGELPSYKIWENERFLAFLDINPVKPGHTILIPKKHIDYIFDLKEPLYLEMFKIAKKLSKVIQQAVGSKKIGLAVEGIFIHHAHIHLIPVSKGNDLNPTKAKKGNLKELLKIQEKIIIQIKK